MMGSKKVTTQKDGSHHSNGGTLTNTNNFDELEASHDTEFDMYNLPILPSLQQPPPPMAATFGINDIGVMASLTLEESKEEIDSGKATGVGGSSFVVKRGMPPEELAKLAIVDPKKAKRIIANRKAAAKSKERKKIYAKELEERVNMLQVHADIFFANLASFRRNTEARVVENLELRMQIEALGQHLQQRCALRDAMKEELNYYRIMNNQFAIEMANDPCYSELQSKFSSMLASRRRQCSNLQPQHHQAVPLEPEISLPPFPPSLPFGQDFNEQCGPNFSSFNEWN